MIRRTITIGTAMLMCAIPAAAQERGTTEFGLFGSAGTFDKTLTLNSGAGLGGRIGVYLDPRLALEFDASEMNSSRTLGLKNVNVGMLSARAVGTIVHAGPFALLLGAGAGASTETSFSHSYGLNGLLGAKVAISDNVAVRLDGIVDWLANYSWKSQQRVQLGFSFARSPNHTVRTVDVMVAAPPVPQRPDSVNAEEQDRRRHWERDYRALRDSVNAIQPCSCAVPPRPVDVETMSQRIQFKFDKSDLSGDARSILDEKVVLFNANPSMKIYITGHTDNMGTETYNMALGERRAAAAKAYLVSKGVSGDRVILDSKGESQPVVTPPNGEQKKEAPNRRDMFVLITTDAVRQP